ncbi:TetR/AcrR family transcriptional regulator [Microterricola viridarii]|uniref:DNA-binding transcriptional regulator, AcrR family n=1 Tax=Microterricola viridarii TaxID=412690 RepID=A0A1H1NHR6_9MICO|nr:TetR/AcrR family transcriptional regulator [Microterricola viridarii]SDR98463.1 DNA-binding transcriptional regulator, AcrR family [Microterricola viridarii]
MGRSSGTKRAILDAALELAATRGITGTTMDDVAERAGVAKGSLYYNFSSKDQLFEALLEEGVGALAENLRAARGTLVGWEAIEALVGALLDRIAANASLAKLMASEIFRTDRAWQKTLFALRHEALAVFAEAIAEASSGASAPGAQPSGAQGADAGTPASGASTIMAASVFGAVLMSGLEWLVFEPERGRDEVAAAILASLSGAFAPR